MKSATIEEKAREFKKRAVIHHGEKPDHWLGHHELMHVLRAHLIVRKDQVEEPGAMRRAFIKRSGGWFGTTHREATGAAPTTVFSSVSGQRVVVLHRTPEDEVLKVFRELVLRVFDA